MAFRDYLGYGKEKAEVATPRQLDPRYKQMVDESTKMAQDYRTELPSIQSQNANIIADQGRRELAGNMANVDNSMNRRGMFYGGRRQGARAGAESNTAADVADKIQKSNLSAQQNLQDIEGNALEAGTNYQSQLQGTYDDAYNEALSRRQQRLDRQGGIFRGIGKAVGGLLGSSQTYDSLGKMKAKKTPSSTTYAGGGEDSMSSSLA